MDEAFAYAYDASYWWCLDDVYGQASAPSVGLVDPIQM